MFFSPARNVAMFFSPARNVAMFFSPARGGATLSMRTTPSICGASAALRAVAASDVTSSTNTRTRRPTRAASLRALMAAARSMKRA